MHLSTDSGSVHYTGATIFEVVVSLMPLILGIKSEVFAGRIAGPINFTVISFIGGVAGVLLAWFGLRRIKF